VIEETELVAVEAVAPAEPERPSRRAWSSRISARHVSGGALVLLVAFAAYVAVHLHRRGHTTGDDFALYLRQATSIFEGNIAQVISDNRLLWSHSVGVTPQMYPWGFALILAPFVRLWGLDYGRLKDVEVVCFCVWLVLFHGIVRRRTGRAVAIVMTAVFATAPLYLVHTDQLLSELPHMLVVATVIWWLDRILLRHRLTEAPVSQLVVLGLLIVAAYNVRRESVVFVAVIAMAQLVDVLGARSAAHDLGQPSPWRRGRNPLAQMPWRRLAIPYLSFAAGSAIAQFLLPSTLVPDNGNSRRFITTRLFNLNDPDRCPNPSSRSCANYPKHLLLQLGLDERPVYGLIVICLAVAGAVIACAKSPRLNVPLVTLMATTMLVIGTHFRMVARYYFQVTPLVVLFLTILLVTAAAEVAMIVRSGSARVRNVMVGLALAPLAWLVVIHLWSIPSKIDAAARFNDSGSVQSGPTNPKIEPAFEMVEEHTRPDDIIVFYRARTLTLYTDRRALQLGTTAISTMTELGDYFMQNKQSNYSQPVATPAELEALGYEIVAEDTYWRLWRIPHDD
jgi:hypothetical protein